MGRNKSEDSAAGMIRALTMGESYGRTTRLSMEEAGPTAVTAALAKLRGTVNQVVARIRKEIPGSYFRVEGAVGFTDDKAAVLVTVAATRLNEAEEQEDEENDI